MLEHTGFREMLPFAVLLEAAIGAALVWWIWPAIGRLHRRWSTFLLPAATVMVIELSLLGFALLVGQAEVSAAEAGWWWAIGQLPSFLAGTLAYMIRQALMEEATERSAEIRAIEERE